MYLRSLPLLFGLAFKGRDEKFQVCQEVIQLSEDTQGLNCGFFLAGDWNRAEDLASSS